VTSRTRGLEPREQRLAGDGHGDVGIGRGLDRGHQLAQALLGL
jgi:hypothetical protein